MTELKLEDFCAVHDSREYLHQPFKVDELAVASNGHIMLTKPIDGEYPEVTENTRIHGVVRDILGRFEGLDFEPIPDVDIPKKDPCSTCDGAGQATVEECPECDGVGEAEAENDFNTYWVLCKSCAGEGEIVQRGPGGTCPNCSGDGFVWPYAPVQLLGVTVNAKYLARIKDVAGIEVAATEDGRMLLFRSGEWRGSIMTLKL